MNNLDFIRGVLEGNEGSTISLSDNMSDGEFCVYLDNGHVCRYWSCAVEEDVDLEDPGMYMDAEDDIDMIMSFLMSELINLYNPQKS